MVSICGERIQYLKIGFRMLQMTSEFYKRFIYGENDVYMWEMA